jgi:hypothetical protein
MHLLADGDELRLGDRTIVVFHSADADDDRSRTEAAHPTPELDSTEHRVLVALCSPVLSGDTFTPPATVTAIAAGLAIGEVAVERILDGLADRFGIDASDPTRDGDRRARLAHEVLACGAVGISDLRAERSAPPDAPDRTTPAR